MKYLKYFENKINLNDYITNDDIEITDIELVNKISLFILNIFKRKKWKGIVIIPQQTKILSFIKKGDEIKIYFKKNIYRSYFSYYKKPNEKYTYILAFNKLDISTIHHEVKHLINFDNDINADSHIDTFTITDTTKYKNDRDIKEFIFLMTICLSSEMSSIINEITYELKYKIKPKKIGDLSKNEFYKWYDYIIYDDMYGDNIITKLKKSKSFRRIFFSKLLYSLDNIDDIKTKNNIFRKVLGMSPTIDYDKKISQKDADELSKKWIDYLKRRAILATNIIKKFFYEKKF
jgi:hypothetical protein